MLANSEIFNSFSVDDTEKARQFYGAILGLTLTTAPMGLLELNTGGNAKTLIYPKEDHTPATFTVLNFQVPDIEGTVKALKEKGITFESYDMPELKTGSDHIFRDETMHMAIAWFRDPAGNILSVLEKGSKE